jgi:hypothetical protein
VVLEKVSVGAAFAPTAFWRVAVTAVMTAKMIMFTRSVIKIYNSSRLAERLSRVFIKYVRV